ncbi:GNAT family N-acetyltransferase [Motilibacter deserti]|uniref:GNAT family N-acetyltransferase n=1 Tax=Motilibacter deserti TaxID=2714956 RepID=A0ABX0GPT1_9ACTN|nr:GNAT family N-acetyltransferase [Motilibacter deserti]NHC12458.1 GNAT family N-acetyltransferase [Motilibacter deserti]
MTLQEFEPWQAELSRAYAAEQVAAGVWTADEALDRALEGSAALLPDGLATPGMLLLLGVLPDGTRVGRVWIGLQHPRGIAGCAFVYDLEVEPEHRGRGLGRELLSLGERAARDHGARAVELNVFGTNATAIALYASAGYRVVTQQMRKELAD